MIGQAAGGRVLTAAGSRPGDAILLTKAVAIEGTAVLAQEHARELRRHLPPRLLRLAQGFLRKPGIPWFKEIRKGAVPLKGSKMRLKDKKRAEGKNDGGSRHQEHDDKKE